MIYQGSNKAIELEFDEAVANVASLSVTIFDAKGVQVIRKKAEDLIIDGSKIYIPVTQEQTSNFSVGKAKILVKWKGEDGYIDFAEEALVDVVGRDDRMVIL